MGEPYRKTSRPWAPQRDRQEAPSPEAKRPEGAVGFFLVAPVAQREVRQCEAP